MAITTQQTGKVPKAIQLAGVLIILASVVACASGNPAAGAGAIFGFMVGGLLYAVGRFAAWWWYG